MKKSFLFPLFASLILCVTMAAGLTPDGLHFEIEAGSDAFKLLLTDISLDRPLIVIKRIPRIPAKHVSLEKHRGYLHLLPFSFSLDIDLDGNADLEVSPGNFPGIINGKFGFQVNHHLPSPEKKGMPGFDRIEIQLHSSLSDDSILRKRNFKINRVILKRLKDGNIEIILRDKFYKSGKDQIFHTKFSW